MPADRSPQAGGGTQCCRIGAVALAVALAGCATRVDVRPMATGRADTAAYELNGGDLPSLRGQAQRLCPLGGEIVREAGHSLPPEASAGRWRSTVNTLAAWAEPPRRPAQLVVVCRKGGDHDRLQAAVAPAALAPRTTVPLAATAVPRATVPSVELTAALPIGPINPEW